MQIYILLSIILIFASILENHLSSRKEKVLIYTFSFLLILFFACFRSVNVGADTDQYYYGYEQLFSIPLKKALSIDIWDISYKYTFDWEIGYRIYNKLIAFITHINNGQIMTFFNSSLYCFFMYKFIKENSHNPCLSIFLCVTLGFYQTALNMMPNAIVTAVIFYSLKYLEKETIKYIAIVLCLSLFHTSSLFYLVLIPFNKYKFNLSRMTLFTVVILALTVLFNIVVKYLLLIIPNRYAYFFTKINGTYIVKTEQILVWVVHLFLLVFIFLFMKICKNNFKIVEYIDTIPFKIFFLESFFYLLTLNISGFSRMAFLFSPYFIITIPDLINKLQLEKNKRFLILVIIIVCFLQYVVRLSFNNIGGTLPYEFFYI